MRRFFLLITFLSGFPAFAEDFDPQGERLIYVTFLELEAAEKPRFFELIFPSFNLPEVENGKTARVFDERASFIEALSQPPRTDFPATNVAKRGIVGVFTDPQFQITIRAALKELALKEIPASSIMARSGEHALVQDAAKRWGIVPVIGADGYTIDLEYYLPSPGEAFFSDGPGSRDPERVTIWDGQTVAWAEEKKDRSWRIVFIKAVLMDPAGKPVNDEGKRNAPEK